jgi:hypothetical protein
MNKRAEKINYKKANYAKAKIKRSAIISEEPESKAISINQIIYLPLVSL